MTPKIIFIIEKKLFNGIMIKLYVLLMKKLFDDKGKKWQIYTHIVFVTLLF